jgi:hypothetical protein
MRGHPGDPERSRDRLTESLQIFESIGAAKDVERAAARKELVGA